jgi:bifunctional non-homologous end joining protein LigD
MEHATQWGPSALRRVKIQEKRKVGEYLIADTIEGVMSLAQMGIVEIHTWNTTIDDVPRPNRIVWDRDPVQRWSGSRSSPRPRSCATCSRRLVSSRG